MSKDRLNFRGLAKNNEWCYGSLLYYAGDAQIWEQDGKNYIVKPETLGQCTGLKDKNGNLIYEGDILKTNKGEIYYIAFDEKTASFREEKQSAQVYSGGHHLSLWAEHYKQFYEVIGNIYENKDLLERTTNE